LLVVLFHFPTRLCIGGNKHEHIDGSNTSCCIELICGQLLIPKCKALVFEASTKQRKPQKKQELAQRWPRRWGWCPNFEYVHSREKALDTYHTQRWKIITM